MLIYNVLKHRNRKINYNRRRDCFHGGINYDYRWEREHFQRSALRERLRDKLVIDILSRLLNAESFVAFYPTNLRLHA